MQRQATNIGNLILLLQKEVCYSPLHVATSSLPALLPVVNSLF